MAAQAVLAATRIADDHAKRFEARFGLRDVNVEPRLEGIKPRNKQALALAGRTDVSIRSYAAPAEMQAGCEPHNFHTAAGSAAGSCWPPVFTCPTSSGTGAAGRVAAGYSWRHNIALSGGKGTC